MKRIFSNAFFKWSALACSFLALPQARAELPRQQAQTLIEAAIAPFRPEIARVHGLPVEVLFRWDSSSFQALGGRIA